MTRTNHDILRTLLLTAAACVLALSGAGCITEVDTTGLEPIAGYDSDPTYSRIDVTGETPGHGDSYRVIYYNDIAASYTGSGQYPVGTMIVKEIRKNDDGMPGDLSYIGIMRKIGRDAAAPSGGANDGGWVITRASDGDDDTELYSPSCWDRCHVQGPIDGVFFDYGK